MKRILVVDDEPAIGRLIERAARQCGYDAAITTGADEFMRQWSHGGADAIILDLSLPGTDGIELLRFLAANQCRARILIMSGFDPRVLETAASLASARGLNVVGTLGKPVHLTELREAIGSLTESDPQ